MLVKFVIDNGKSHNSENKTEWLDTVEDLGLDDGLWEEMDDDDKHEMSSDYWLEKGLPTISYEEQEA